MSNAQEAAENIKSLANKFKSLFQAAEELEKIGSLEQAARDAEIRKDAAYKEADQAQAELKFLKNVINERELAVHDLEKSMDQMEVNANAKASQICSDGQAKADEILNVANQRKSMIEGEIKSARQELDRVKNEISMKNEELIHFNKEIAAMKAKVSAFVK